MTRPTRIICHVHNPIQYRKSFEDGTITIQGDKTGMSGPLAGKAPKVARKAGMTFQAMSNHSIRTYQMELR